MYNMLPLLFTCQTNEYQCGKAKKYLALGDSLAVGVSAFWGLGYTRLYYKWLLDCIGLCDLYYHNLGVIKLTSEKMLNLIRSDQYYRAEIQDSTIITIDIGGNDILCFKHSPERLNEALNCFKYNFYTILHEIRSLNNYAKIYLMDIYNPYPIGHEMHDISEVWVTQFNSVIRSTQMISQYGISGIANVYTAFKGNEYKYTLITRNNIHPNTLGHKVICDCYKSVTTI